MRSYHIGVGIGYINYCSYITVRAVHMDGGFRWGNGGGGRAGGNEKKMNESSGGEGGGEEGWRLVAGGPSGPAPCRLARRCCRLTMRISEQ